MIVVFVFDVVILRVVVFVCMIVGELFDVHSVVGLALVFVQQCYMLRCCGLLVCMFVWGVVGVVVDVLNVVGVVLMFVVCGNCFECVGV